MRSAVGGRWSVVFWVAFALIAMMFRAAPGQSDPATTETLRVVSLAPSLTEVVFALGREPALVGVTDYCRFPPEASKLPKVGGLFDTSAERILALRPTHVIHAWHGKLEAPLSAAGVRVVGVKGETLADIRGSIGAVAAALGAEARGREVVARMDEELAAIAESRAGKPRPRALMVIGYDPASMRNITAAGPGTFLDELLSVAGGDNALAGTSVPYPTLSREHLVAHPPALIIDCGTDAETPRTEVDRAALRAKWLELLARKPSDAPRIIFLDDPHLTIPGPGIVESVRRLAEAMEAEALTGTPESPSKGP